VIRSLRSIKLAHFTLSTLAAAALLVALNACASSSSTSSRRQHGAHSSASVLSATPHTQGQPETAIVLSREPWTYAGADGDLIITRNFLIHTTERDPALIRRLPIFLEAALLEYRFALTPTSGPLPAPPREMPTYLFANRGQ